MIKTFLSLLFISILLWFAMDYFGIKIYSEKLSNKQISTYNNTQSMHVQKIKTKTNSPILTEKDLTLNKLLNKDLFYDALAYYLEHSSNTNREKIESYLASLSKKNAFLSLEYMKVFLDNVHESTVPKLMITTYIAQGNLSKAIALIMDAKDNYVSDYEDKRLGMQLRDVIIKHIDVLMKRKEYAQLIKFLEKMISYDDADSFYKFRLAKLHILLDNTIAAEYLLEALQYDEIYAKNANTLLNNMHQEEVHEESYQYAIPLHKYGEHYTVHVLLDGIEFNLMLDTGATYIFIDEEKASGLKVSRKEITLHTGGHNIFAKMGTVSHLKVGNIELANMDVAIAPFQRDNIDGLLGMNFFKLFTFFIDQEEDILYLDRKGDR